MNSQRPIKTTPIGAFGTYPMRHFRYRRIYLGPIAIYTNWRSLELYAHQGNSLYKPMVNPFFMFSYCLHYISPVRNYKSYTHGICRYAFWQGLSGKND